MGARTITVRVSDHRGEPLAGQVVTAANQGNNQLTAPVETGADGVAVISGLYGGLANVSVAPAGTPGARSEAGAIDLEQGDGALEYEAAEVLRATLRIIADGAPGLPPAIRVWPARIESKDPQTSLVTVAFRLAGEATELATSVNAPGYSAAQLALTRALGVSGAAPLDVIMTRSGALLVEVQRAEGTAIRLVPERQDEGGQWKKDSPFEHQYPNADDGRFRFDSLTAGRYRVRDAESGAATEIVYVDPALGDARATLDLTRHGLAQGTVIGPDGFDLSAARVIVAGADTLVADNAWQVIPGAPKGSIAVGRDGAFSLPVSLDRPVVLRAWHPVLAPAAEGGELRIDGPRDGIRLRLVEGPTCEWTMPKGFAGRQRTSVRVLLYRDHARAELGSEHVAERSEGRARFGGFVPGTYTLWIDLDGQFAPLVLNDVVLGEERTDLGGVPFTAGSAVRVILRPQSGASPPRIFVSAFSEETAVDGSALYNRQLNSRGEAEVVLAGLGAGTFSVRVGSIGAGDLMPIRVITLDGQRDEVIEIDL